MTKWTAEQLAQFADADEIEMLRSMPTALRVALLRSGSSVSLTSSTYVPASQMEAVGMVERKRAVGHVVASTESSITLRWTSRR
jgi:hypothetical protein